MSPDYDSFADTYARTRSARQFILAVLDSAFGSLQVGARIVDVGCGTGNYSIALKASKPHLIVYGFDASERMLEVARSRTSDVIFSSGDADRAFPYTDEFADGLFCVDVIHHLRNLPRFFSEAYRVVLPGGPLLIVTDSEDDMRRRSLTRFFPDTLNVDLTRYPSIDTLRRLGVRSKFSRARVGNISAVVPIDDTLIDQLAQRCSSSLRLISEEAHQRGLQLLREAAASGKSWVSRYTTLTFRRAFARKS